MAVPAKKKIKHYRGDDFRYSFRVETVTDDTTDPPTTEVKDLTGWTVAAESDPDVDTTESTPDATGVVTISATAEAIEAGAPPGTDTWLFDVQLTDPTGFRRTYVKVTVVLQEQVA